LCSREQNFHFLLNECKITAIKIEVPAILEATLLFFCKQVKHNKCLRFEADAWRLGSQSCSVKLMTDFGSGILE